MNKLYRIFVVAMICLVVSSIAVYAATLLSNSEIREVKPIGLHLDVTPTSFIYIGATFTLTATLTPAVPSKGIYFYWNGTLIDSAATDASGIATITFTPSSSGFYNFTATCNYS